MSEEQAIAKTETKRLTVMESLAQNQDKIEQALSGALDPVQFMSICARMYTATPKLKQAPWSSFVMACVEAAQLGLTPGGTLGECYIIPRYNRDTEGQWAYFQLGYRGAMKLARRGGELLDISPELVYENDEFHETKGTKRSIHHVPWYCMGHEESGEIIASYCTAKLRTGEVAFRTITREDIDKARASTKNKWQECSNVWRDHFEAMAMKTAVHRLTKFLPIPDAAKEAIIRDEYREAGVSEATITVDAGELEREALLNHPAVIEKKALESSHGKAWSRAIKFCAAANVYFHRDKISTFRTLVLWLNGDEGPWPDTKAGQIEAYGEAVRHLDAWKESGEAGEALCLEFAQLIAKADADAAFEAAQNGGER